MPELDDMTKIQQLESFKSLIEAFREGESQLSDGTNVRSAINQSVRVINDIVMEAGCGKIVQIAPPPAIGGPISRVNPLYNIFNPPHDFDLTDTVVDLIDESIGAIKAGLHNTKTNSSMPDSMRSSRTKNKVFVVHGHDEGMRESTARLLEKVGVQPIILHEQGNQGRTIIEKLESNSDVPFAIVLMTPDDVGAKASEQGSLKLRARQNVVLELGYFMGKLGRKNVVALLSENVEKPSDIDGVLYIPINNGDVDSWRYQLLKELKAAGYDIDLNALS